MKQAYLESIKLSVPQFKELYADIPFKNAGIDSIDLVTIRVELERLLGATIPDVVWLEFETVSQLLDYCAHKEKVQGLKTKKTINLSQLAYKVDINMPQMALEALSENWLFKELGDAHWNLICHGLNTTSADLKDALGNRLYATFVRIRIHCTPHLKAFKESDVLDIKGHIKRFGESMYFSRFDLTSQEASIEADLMTTFSIRNQTDNTKLAKSQPNVLENTIEPVSKIPDFAEDYRLLRKNDLACVTYKHLKFDVQDHNLYQMPYTLNPYYDLNGVNLLYFAAYPIINDYCEAQYFNTVVGHQERWEQEYYTAYKDVFYFSNCNINDTVIYRLLNKTQHEDGSVQLVSELVRKSDALVMARIFSVKIKVGL